MTRRKVEFKKIEDKKSRLVTHWRKRAKFFDKAKEISILCDAEIGVMFSETGHLHQFSTSSVTELFNRYKRMATEPMITQDLIHQLQVPYVPVSSPNEYEIDLELRL